MKDDTSDLKASALEHIQKSVTDTNNSALTLEKLRGQRWAWPLAAISEWVLFPKANRLEGAGLPLDKLVISAGLRRATLQGLNLHVICDLLDKSAGARVVERGERYAAYANKELGTDHAYVTTLEIENLTDELPAADSDNDSAPDGAGAP